jgi:hypothetical protein
MRSWTKEMGAHGLAELEVEVGVVLDTEWPTLGLLAERNEDDGTVDVNLDSNELRRLVAVSSERDVDSTDLGDVHRSGPDGEGGVMSCKPRGGHGEREGSPALVRALMGDDDSRSRISAPLIESMQGCSLARKKMHKAVRRLLTEVESRAEVVLEHEPRRERDDLCELVLCESRAPKRESVQQKRTQHRIETYLSESFDVGQTGVDILATVGGVDQNLRVGGNGLEREGLVRKHKSANALMR